MKYHIVPALLAAAFMGNMLSATAVCAADSPYQAMKDEIVMLINERRSAVGAQDVYESELLNCAADIRAKEIVASFSHTRPSGSKCSSVLAEVNISWMATGENIAAGYSGVEDVMDGWTNSSGHYANMINSKYNAVGIGITKENDRYYWVQIFTDGMNLSSIYTTGNFNGDDAVDAVDAAMILNDAAETGAGNPSVLSSLQKKFADIYPDKCINASDATRILQYAAYTGTGGTDSIDLYFGLS